MGLLTSNDPRAELTVEFSEFAHNLRPRLGGRRASRPANLPLKIDF
jgi:hypothetical protein